MAAALVKDPEDGHPGGVTSPNGGGTGNDLPTTPAFGNTAKPEASATGVIPTVASIFALLIYAGMVCYLMMAKTKDDADWTHSIYLLSGIETIAFAAAGFLFGREVNRARAENAENLAQTEAHRANTLTVERNRAVNERNQVKADARILSEKIRILADVEQTRNTAPPEGPAEVRAAAAPAAPATVFTRDRLRELARDAERLL